MRSELLPVFAQVALTFALLGATGFSRTQALRARQVKMSEVALGQQAWPPRVTQIGNAFNNQMQMPMLFLIVVGFALQAQATTPMFVAFSWAYVFFRYVHALIHVTSNRVPIRFAAFLLSNVCLASLWIQFFVKAS